jgi:hypothetical protein
VVHPHERSGELTYLREVALLGRTDDGARQRLADRVSDVFLVAHARCFPRKVTQVEEAGAPDDAFAHDLDLLDPRRVREEDALDAHVEAHLSHGERAPAPSAVTLDDDPLENLGALLVSLDDAVVHAHSVADPEIRKIGA